MTRKSAAQGSDDELNRIVRVVLTRLTTKFIVGEMRGINLYEGD